MKVNYQQKNKSKNSYLKQVSIFILVFVVGSLFFRYFGGSILSILKPVWQSKNFVLDWTAEGLSYFKTKESLIDENAQLKEKLDSLELKILSLSKNKLQENQILELAGRRVNPQTVIATVLTHPPQTPYDVIVIDAGSDDGIVEGSLVELSEGVDLGRVVEVFPGMSKVRLYSAGGEETSAVLERNNVPVSLIGVGAGNFKIAVPRDVEVVEGDRILSATINSRLLAVVGDISFRPTDSFQEVRAKSPTNIFGIRFVFVTP